MSDKFNLEKIPKVIEQAASSESQESMKKPEQQAERTSEQVMDLGDTTTPTVQLPDDKSTDTDQATVDAIVLSKVENILSQNMDKVFLEMDVATQAKFKLKGEETARKIAVLLTKTRVKIKEVISLVMDWLRIIPKVNKFYLEQEAKIKADAIIKMHKK